jgi:hypothetical protein
MHAAYCTNPLLSCLHAACCVQVDDWLAEAGVTPPGNGVEAHLWGAGGLRRALWLRCLQVVLLA